MLTQFENQLADFLSNNAQVRKIDFHFENAGGGFHISPQGFARVARAIRQERIRACTGSTSLGAGIAGLYYQNTNRFELVSDVFPAAVNPRGIIVHEAVHALIDLCKCVATTRLSDEAAAYLAQVVFMFQNGRRTFTRPQYTAAYDLAKASGIIDPATNAVHAGVRLTWQQYEPLRREIHNRPAYQTVGWLAPTGASGIAMAPQHPCTL
ncbi:MAG: hypothetical protein L0215_14435 [Gemmataceae bacterium]|nr:hypothetical protein [Gemmataceae bacterium]